MKEELDKNLKNFDKIWSRVTEHETSQPLSLEQERERLATFITGERARLAAYEYAAKALRGTDSATLRSLAGETRQRLRLLQLEHYLLTGDTCPRAPTPSPPKGGLAGLRTLYLAQERACADYLQAAALCGRGTLRQLYVTLAEECNRHSAALHKVMSHAMN